MEYPAGSFCILLRFLGLLSWLSVLSFLRETDGRLAFLPISKSWNCWAVFSLTVKQELIGSGFLNNEMPEA